MPQRSLGHAQLQTAARLERRPWTISRIRVSVKSRRCSTTGPGERRQASSETQMFHAPHQSLSRFDTSGAAYLGDRSRRLRPRSRCCRHRAVCFTPCLTGSSLAAALTGAAAGAPLAAIACAPPEARRAESPPTASFAAGTPRRGRQETPSHVQALATVSGLR